MTETRVETALGAERARRSRGSITPAEILEGAFAHAGLVGLDALSMPELARTLDIPVTSLYWHFRRKDELLAAMVEEAATGLPQLLPMVGTSPSWHVFLADYFSAMRAVFRENDVFADLLLVRIDLHTPEAERRLAESRDRIAQYLAASGFDPGVAARIVGALTTFTQGAILSERNQLRRLGQAGPAGADFAFGLDTLVEGFRAMLER